MQLAEECWNHPEAPRRAVGDPVADARRYRHGRGRRPGLPQHHGSTPQRRGAGADHRRGRASVRARRPADRGSGSTWSSSPPTRPARCTSAAPAGRRSATRWRRIFAAPGADVTREYYFNDHGAQIDRFARSLLAALAASTTPDDGYGGDYIADIAARSSRQHRSALGLPDDPTLRRSSAREGVELMFAEIKQTLHDFGVDFDVYFHENSLHESRCSGARDRPAPRAGPHLTRPTARLWLRTTEFGDDKDRVRHPQRRRPAYIAGDLAYYLDKRERGFDRCIIMLGADHHGYVGRMMAMCRAFGDDAGRQPRDPDRPDGQPRQRRRAGPDDASARARSSRSTISSTPSASTPRGTRWPATRSDSRSTSTSTCGRSAPTTTRSSTCSTRTPGWRRSAQRRRARRRPPETLRRRSCSITSERRAARRARRVSRASSPTAAELREPHRVARYLEELAGDVPQVLRRVPGAAAWVTRRPTDVHRTRLLARRGHPDGARQRAAPARRHRAGADVTDGLARGRRAARRRRLPWPGCGCGCPLTSTRWCRGCGRAPSSGPLAACCRVGGRRRRRDRRKLRHAGVRARRARLPVARARFRGRLRHGLRDVRPVPRRLLRGQGVPLHLRHRALGRRGGPAPRRLHRRRARRGAAGGLPARIGSACTATTSPRPSSPAPSRPGVGRIVVDSLSEIDRLSRLAARPGHARDGDGAGHRRGRGAHPRVHRHRARGPEVRLLARRRMPLRAPSRGARRARSRAARAALAHRLADLRHRRLRGRRPPRARAARARCATSTASSCPSSTSAAASASPTPRRTTRRRRHESGRRAGARSSERSARRSASPCRAVASSPAARSPARATFTLYEVGTVKPVALDGGCEPDLRRRRRRHERQHPHRAVRRGLLLLRSPAAASDAPPVLARVVGKHCESGDIVVRDEFLPATSGQATCSPFRAPAPTAAQHGQQLQPRAAAAGGRGARRRGAGDRPPRDRGRPAPARRRLSWARAWHAQSTSRIMDDGRADSKRCPRLANGPEQAKEASNEHACVSRCSDAASSASEVARLLTEHADDLAARVGAAVELVGIAVRRPAAIGRNAAWTRAVHHRRRRAGHPRRRRRRRRGDRRHRAGPLAHPRRDGVGRVRRHRQQGAAGRGRRDAARRRREARRRPLLRGRRRAARSRCCGRCASRSAGDRVRRVLGHRQRHDELRPRQDGRPRRRVRRGARGGPGARLRRGRPDRGRRGFRRRRQGRHPGRRSRSTPGSSPRTSTARASPTSPPPTSPAPGRWAPSSSCSPSASCSERRGVASGSACTRR